MSFKTTLCILCLITANSLYAKVDIEELSWMTGTWSGPAGPNTLEENWTVPHSGSIQAVVRMTNGSQTSMVELIVIEEQDDTLVLSLQQWGPNFRPLTEKPTRMTLVEARENYVEFRLVGEGSFHKLAYRKTESGEFQILVTPPNANEIVLKLTAK